MTANALISHIHAYIQQHNLIPPQSHIIVGLSGGPDSLFLLHVLADMRKSHTITLCAAHLDHEWRPESAQEALFCKQICADLNIPYVTKKISELNTSIPNNGSKEEYARRMRRYFFEQVKTEQSADGIALAHHAQDQEETFFIRLIRGTTATGLAAMYPQHGPYIRPLLKINKIDIVNYLDTHTIRYLTDPTNISLEFLRNRIRQQVLPALYDCDKRIHTNFQRTIQHLQNTELFLANLTAQICARITEHRDGALSLHINLFHQQEPFMQYRILMWFITKAQVPFTPTDAFLSEIVRFLAQKQSKSHQLHQSWRIIKKNANQHQWASIHKSSY